MEIFGHEKLKVYQSSLQFVDFVYQHTKDLPKSNNIIDQINRASNSIPLNIAEGNGKLTPKDKARFFDIARGSAFECASCLDVMLIRTMLDESAVLQGKMILHEIVSMLVGLIKSVSTRVHDGDLEYSVGSLDI
ncbi:MAG: four helix bundle protein [Melioribacteraceae bacterium]|nr:four helix bundle protein [Melioribacteraceae bacterium]MCF8265587.1 four helix bundle protein [Melioribacteraceae bacterium]MCF8431526.1 four helix bundle protein [Melioribacteraceae bacterium]